MSNTSGRIPDLTLEMLSRTFFKEATKYGFTHVDYVRYVNLLLDMAMQGRSKDTEEGALTTSPVAAEQFADSNGVELPLKGDGILTLIAGYLGPERRASVTRT